MPAFILPLCLLVIGSEKRIVKFDTVGNKLKFCDQSDSCHANNIVTHSAFATLTLNEPRTHKCVQSLHKSITICGYHYIGETGLRLSTRVKQHKDAVRKGETEKL